MLLTIDSSSPPWTHSPSNRLGPTGPFPTLVPWHAAQTSPNFAAIGLPRPPPRPGGGPCGAAAGAPCAGGAGAPAGGCRPVIEAARSTVVPRMRGIDFIGRRSYYDEGA